MENKTSKTVLAALLLFGCFLLYSWPAYAGCEWTSPEDGALDRANYLESVKKMEKSRIIDSIKKGRDRLAACLGDESFIHYYCSASIVIGRYGRKSCKWPPAGPGSADREEHYRRAIKLDRQGMVKDIDEKLAALAKCLDRPMLDSFFVEMSLLQAEYGLGMR